MINVVTPRNSYVANGVTTAFSYTFRILDQTHIKVYKDGVLQTLTTHYTVSGVNADGGGTITFLSAPANLARIDLVRSTPLSQLSTYLNFEQNDLTAAQTLESAVDKLTMILQEINGLLVPFLTNQAVAAGQATVVVTHNLNSSIAKVLGAIPNWTTIVTVISQDANTVTLGFSVQAPGAGGTVTVEIVPGI